VRQVGGATDASPVPAHVRPLLERGVSPRDVAELIGDTQPRLTQVLKDACSEPAMLVAISGGKAKR